MTSAVFIVAAHYLWEFRARSIRRPALWEKQIKVYLARVKYGESAVSADCESLLGQVALNAQRAGYRMEPGLTIFALHCHALGELGKRAERFKRFVLLKWSFMLGGLVLLRLAFGGSGAWGFEDRIFCLLGGLLLMTGLSTYLSLLRIKDWDLDEAQAARILAQSLAGGFEDGQALQDEVGLRISKWQELLPIFEIGLGFAAAGLWLFHPSLYFMNF